jgi:hypothetical protein
LSKLLGILVRILLDHFFHGLRTIISNGRDLREDFVFARLEVDFAGYRPGLPHLHRSDTTNVLAR